MDGFRTRLARTAVTTVVAIGACLLPSLVLRSPETGTAVDYYLHSWMVGYHGEVWKEQQAFPTTYHTAEQVGVAIPLFYGFTLYKVAGLLSAVWGAHVALRLLVLFSTVAVYLTVRYTVRRFGATEVLATATACLACWATYPLTNVYNRSAYPEFVAVSLLTCSVCAWALFFLAPRTSTGWPAALAGGFSLAFAASAHPITGMLSVPILGVMYGLHWFVPVTPRPGVVRRHTALAVSGLLACLVLSPWLLAYRALGSQVALTFVKLWHLDLPTWTNVWVRLFPLPLDYHFMTPSGPQLGVRHLDTQINVPLLILALAAVAAVTRSTVVALRPRLLIVAGAALLFAVGVFVLSVSPEAVDRLPRAVRTILAKVQFGYRLVATVDVAILVLFLLVLAFRRATDSRQEPGRWSVHPVVLAVVVTMSACGLSQKLMNGRAVCTPHGDPLTSSDPAYQAWLVSFNCTAGWAYFTPEYAPRLAPGEAGSLHPAKFPIGTGPDFGRAMPIHVELSQPAYVATQGVPFRWNTFRVDGHPIPPNS